MQSVISRGVTMFRLALFVGLCALALSSPELALADTYYVPDDFTTIQDALDAAVGGDIIIVRDGIYTGIGNKNLDFGGKALTLRSENGPANCVIDGEELSRAFYFHSGETSDSILDGFTLSGCHPVSGGGAIYCNASSPTITNCVFDGNTSSDCGAGIRCTNSAAPVISKCSFSGNNASDYGGAIYCNASSPTIINCAFSENQSTRGGAIYCVSSASPEIVNCTISDNTSTTGGGICAYLSSLPMISNCIIWNNSAGSGQQIYLNSSSSAYVGFSNVEGGQGDVVVGLGCTLNWDEGNIDEDPLFLDAGDYHLSGGSPCIDAGTDMGVYEDIDSDSRPLGGGFDMGCDEVAGIYVPDDYSTIRAALQGAPDGSLIIVRDGVYTGKNNRNLSFNGKTLTVRSENGPENCIIDCENVKGGFVFWAGETNAAVLDGFTIINGNTGFGGGVYCTNSSPTIRNCIFEGGSSAYGAGICLSNSSARIINCTLTGGSGTYGAGGIFFYGSDATVTNCTISDNTAISGAGVFCFSSTPTFTNCIITGNSGTYGPQILLSTSSDMAVSYSNVEDGQAAAYLELDSSFTWGVGNIDADPLFVGGGDYHLTYNSPCVNAGVDTGLSTDIEDDARPLAGGIDMGADEFSTIYYVPDDYPTLRQAMINVTNNCIVVVRDGTYTGPNNRNIAFQNKSVILKSENGPESCIIDCENASGGFIFWQGETSASVLDGFTITNGSTGYGGGIYSVGSSPTIRNCIVTNSSAAYGGGICLSASSATLINCTLAGNSTTYGAGGLFCYGSDPVITHCTISDNDAVSGAGIFCHSSTPTVTNCIVTGNTAPYGPQLLLSTSSIMTISYSNVEGGQADAYLEHASSFTWGSGNIDFDPLFVGGGDYHLTSGSSCIDAGTDAGICCDIDSDVRPSGSGYDIGSDEY